MTLLINIVTAWITVFLMVVLLIIYVLRLLIQKGKVPNNSWIRRFNKSLRKPHKWLGMMAVLTGFVHGLYSTAAILTTNKGTILWLLFMLLGLTYLFRKQLKSWRPWIQVHRYVAISSIIFLFLHLIEVNWFVGIDPIIMAVKRDLEVGATSIVAEVVITDEVVENTFGSLLKQLEDGRYRGEATGYQPGLMVEVTVSNHLITLIEVVKHNEVNKRFWGLPVLKIPLAIVKSQSIDVDIVSGATYTSYGIIKAVEDAIVNSNLVEENTQVTREKLTEVDARDIGETSSEEVVEVIEANEADIVEQSDDEGSVDYESTVENSSEPTTDTKTSNSSADEIITEESDPEIISQEIRDIPEVVIEFETSPVVEEDLSLVEVVTTETLEVEEEVEEVVVEVVEEEVVEVEEVVVVVEEDNGSIYRDGLYVGTAGGYRPNIVVEVVIYQGAIFDVEVIDHNEKNESYWGRPVKAIPEEIIENQSTDVDIVSGATYTSKGIMNAVDNALKKALK